MKTVSIGDTHGIAVADQIRKIINSHDKFIFLGDYVDSYDVDNSSMLKNLLDIIDLKKCYPDKVVLLWGNHDIHYFLGEKFYCSGYRPEMRIELNGIFSTNECLFQLAFQEKDWIWTHAGISELWFRKRLKTMLNGEMPLSEILNQAFTLRYPPLFDVGYSRGGTYISGGPLWCDIDELRDGPLNGYNQVAGHNRIKEFETIMSSGGEKVILIDILQYYKTIDPSCFYYVEV